MQFPLEALKQALQAMQIHVHVHPSQSPQPVQPSAFEGDGEPISLELLREALISMSNQPRQLAG